MNILPTINATGDQPKILSRLAGAADAGGLTDLGTVISSGDKPDGGLDVLGGEDAIYLAVNTGNEGGIRFKSFIRSLNNAIYGIHITGNAYNRLSTAPLADGGLKLRLHTNKNRYRTWYVGGGDDEAGHTLGYRAYIIDPAQAGSIADNIRFNINRIRFISFLINAANGYSQNHAWFNLSVHYRVIKSKAGACGIYGVNPSFNDCASAARWVAWVIEKKAADVFHINVPFKIGDGATQTIFQDIGSILIAPKPYHLGGEARLQLLDESIPFFLDLTQNCQVDLVGTVFNWGLPSPFDFDSNIGAVVTLNNTQFMGIGHITLGSDVSGTCRIEPAPGNRVTLNGANISGEIIGNTYLNTETDLKDLSIEGNLYIQTGKDSVLNFQSVTVSGEVFNLSNNTLTLSLDDQSQLTANNPGTGPWQVNIQRPRTLKIIIEPAITGFEWRIYEDDPQDGVIGSIELAGEESAASNMLTYQYNYTQNKPIVIQIIASGFEESLTPVTLDGSNQTVVIPLSADANL